MVLTLSAFFEVFLQQSAQNIHRNYCWFIKLTALELPSTLHYKLSTQLILYIIPLSIVNSLFKTD